MKNCTYLKNPMQNKPNSLIRNVRFVMIIDFANRLDYGSRFNKV